MLSGFVAPSRAEAGENPITTQYGQHSEGWHPISTSEFGYFGSDGWWTGRAMPEGQFNNMVSRAAYGLQNLGTGAGSGYTSNAAQGAKIINDMHGVGTVAGTVATLRQMKAEGLSMMQRMKSFGVLRAIGDVTLAVTAFEVGYSVGGVIADFLFGAQGEEEGPEAGHVFEAKKIAPRSPEDDLCEDNSNVQEGTCSFTEEELPYGEPVGVIKWREVPFSGLVLGVEPGIGVESEGCIAENSYLRAPVPNEFRLAGRQTNVCGGHLYHIRSGVQVVPLEVTCLPGEEGCEPVETREGKAQTPKEAGGASHDMKECFEGLLGCALLPGWWWNHDPEAKEATTYAGVGTGLGPQDPLTARVPRREAGGETYTHYDKRLEKVDLVPEPIAVPEGQIDPRVGPLDVISVNPEPGTDLQPETKVRVRYNPETAVEGSEESAEGTAPSTWSPPTLPGIDLSPFASIADPCTVFPFGVLCWVGGTLTSWNGAGTCPKITVPIGKTIGQEDEVGINTCQWEPAMEIIRPVLVVLCTLGLGMLFAGWALGGNSGGSADG